MIRPLLKRILGNNLTKSDEKLAKVNFCIIIVMFIISGIMIFFLPNQIPIIHDGPENFKVPTIFGIWLMPTLALIANMLFMIQKRLSKFNTLVFIVILVGMCIYYLSLI